jgi:hypothetical protein
LEIDLIGSCFAVSAAKSVGRNHAVQSFAFWENSHRNCHRAADESTGAVGKRRAGRFSKMPTESGGLGRGIVSDRLRRFTKSLVANRPELTHRRDL